MSEAVSRFRVRITGRVQGVNFRAFTVEHALRMGLKGYVRNLPDGSVEAVIEGDAQKVKGLIEVLRKGPPAAYVQHVDIQEEKPTGEFVDFRVRY